MNKKVQKSPPKKAKAASAPKKSSITPEDKKEKLDKSATAGISKPAENDSNSSDIVAAILAATGDTRVIPLENYLRARYFLIAFNIVSIFASAAALWYAVEANKIQKAQITTQMASSLGSEKVSDALFVVRDTLLNPPVKKKQYDDFLRKIQPLKRNLEALGICVDLGSCNKEYVMRFACDEVLSLANAHKIAAKETGVKSYVGNEYHGLLPLCKNR